MPSRSTYHFHHFQSVLEEDEVRSSSILTIIQQNNHGLRIHFISGEELPVLEAGDNLLGIVLCGLLEGTNAVGLLLCEMSLDFLHVSLQVCQVGFLVEGCGLETHAVNDVVDCLDSVFELIPATILCGGIGALVVKTHDERENTDIDISALFYLDHLAVNLIYDIIDIISARVNLQSYGGLQFVGIGD